jgi:tRNA(fMet)-specific endonuclease VapC
LTYLLDTNICIDFIDGRSATAQQRVRENFASGLNVSAITAAELLVGPKTSEDPVGDRHRIEQFLSVITVRDFDRRASETYAAMVRAIGVKRGSFDRLIGAHAISLGMTLVTNNEKHFAEVPRLMVENWTV